MWLGKVSTCGLALPGGIASDQIQASLSEAGVQSLFTAALRLLRNVLAYLAISARLHSLPISGGPRGTDRFFGNGPPTGETGKGPDAGYRAIARLTRD